MQPRVLRLSVEGNRPRNEPALEGATKLNTQAGAR
jgi:hypothetical protein